MRLDSTDALAGRFPESPNEIHNLVNVERAAFVLNR